MSKSPDKPNILLPALGGAGIAIGAAFGLATMNYGNDRIEALEASFQKERALATEQSKQISTLQSDVAGAMAASEEQIASLQAQAEDQAKSAEREIANLRRQLENALSQASAAGQGDEPMQAMPSVIETAQLDGSAFGLGREALAEEIAAWDVDVLPDGRGLPIGSGDVWTGDEVFAEKCASCHGDFAEGRDAWPVLAGGFDTLADEAPVKTVGSYWPYLSTVWDYVHRSMPFGAAGTLTDDEVYAITAYILYSNDLVDDDFTLSNETFLDVEMYNAEGFIIDDRPKTEYTIWSGEPCMSDCKDGPVEITRRASDVGVTPADDGSMVESVMEKELAALGGIEWGAERLAGSVFMDPDRMAEEEAQGEQMASADATESTDAAPEAADGPDPALVAAGKTAFRQCSACHKVGAGAKNGSGPQLNGVMGRVAGSAEGFKYSNVFKTANADGLVWTEETLAEFLANPKAYMKGTRMSFRGLKSDGEASAIAAYLSTFTE